MVIKIKYDNYTVFLHNNNDNSCKIKIELKTIIKISKTISLDTISQQNIEDIIKEPIKDALSNIFMKDVKE